MTILCFLLDIICLLLERQMVVILPILLERQWRWPSTILSGEPLFYLEPLLIRLFSSLFSGPPPLIRGGAALFKELLLLLLLLLLHPDGEGP